MNIFKKQASLKFNVVTKYDVYLDYFEYIKK